MPAVVQIKVNPTLYIKDPGSTELGRRVIDAALQFIDKHGFDDLTFKKLAEEIDSTEASLYRYFESKRQLLKYLVAWYWSWLDYIISVKTTNISDPLVQLDMAMRLLISFDESFRKMTHIDTALLRRIIVAESARVYLTRQNNKVNEELFEGYHSLCERLVNIVKQINPKYRYADALVATILSSVHKQIFYINHIPGVDPASIIKRGGDKEVRNFLSHLALAALGA